MVGALMKVLRYLNDREQYVITHLMGYLTPEQFQDAYEIFTDNEWLGEDCVEESTLILKTLYSWLDELYELDLVEEYFGDENNDN